MWKCNVFSFGLHHLVGTFCPIHLSTCLVSIKWKISWVKKVKRRKLFFSYMVNTTCILMCLSWYTLRFSSGVFLLTCQNIGIPLKLSGMHSQLCQTIILLFLHWRQTPRCFRHFTRSSLTGGSKVLLKIPITWKARYSPKIHRLFFCGYLFRLDSH